MNNITFLNNLADKKQDGDFAPMFPIGRTKNADWKDSKKFKTSFKSKGQIVEHGGFKYEIVKKEIYQLSTGLRIKNVIIGLITSLFGENYQTNPKKFFKSTCSRRFAVRVFPKGTVELPPLPKAKEVEFHELQSAYSIFTTDLGQIQRNKKSIKLINDEVVKHCELFLALPLEIKMPEVDKPSYRMARVNEINKIKSQLVTLSIRCQRAINERNVCLDKISPFLKKPNLSEKNKIVQERFQNNLEYTFNKRIVEIANECNRIIKDLEGYVA